MRSGETVSRVVNKVLLSLLRCQALLLKRPEPILKIARMIIENISRIVLVSLMGLISRSMCKRVIYLGTVQEKMKLRQMSWEFALQTCNLFMYYLDGRVPQLILGFSEMLFLGETGWWSLEVITIYVMLGIATVKDF
ncbi:uncharacterized protein M6B38_163590 [Iris pallida]|uniref:Uncharacterized protein n=1 Tax=Iris pallida TaxID=29817 RepID=A0AAX6EYK5_IRIPA|nr:uncharacterized protein M6B38_163590 [Iris pallida]